MILKGLFKFSEREYDCNSSNDHTNRAQQLISRNDSRLRYGQQCQQNHVERKQPVCTIRHNLIV